MGGGCCVEEEQTTFRIIREPGQGLGICITGVGVCQHITERKMRCVSLCGGEGIQRVGGGCCVEEEQTTFHIIREPGQGLGICITGVGVCQHITEKKMRCVSLCGGEGIKWWGGGVGR